MGKKIIRLKESDLAKMVTESVNRYLRLEQKSLLMEMAYSPSDFLVISDTQARLAYIHLAKLLLFGNSTNNANDWLTQAINSHTIPYIAAKVTTGNHTKRNILAKSYWTNLFGDNFEDYEQQMRNFCAEAESEVQEGSQKMYHKDAPPHRTIEEAVSIGKSIIMSFAKKVVELSNTNDSNSIKMVLIPYRQELMKDLLV